VTSFVAPNVGHRPYFTFHLCVLALIIDDHLVIKRTLKMLFLLL